GAGYAGDVEGAHARGEQRLVAVAHSRVGYQDPLLVPHPSGEFFRPERVQFLARTVRDGTGKPGDHRRGCGWVRLLPPTRLRMTVHRYVGEIIEQLGRAILALDLRKQFRRRVDEPRRIVIACKGRMADDCLKEGEVGGHAPNAEFAQRPDHAGDRLLRRWRPCRHLFQERIVVAGDDRAGIGGSAIQSDAEAGRPTIGSDAPVVGNEILLRVFGGDAALQRMTVQPDGLLRGDAAFRRADGRAIEEVDLRLDDVDTRDLLRHRMLDLNARIDLDEIDVAAIGIHEELDGAGTDIARLARDPQRIAAQFLSPGFVEIGRRRAFNDLLVASLDRA